MAEKNTNNKKKRRLDSNRIALKAGESQRPNGTYCYRYRSRDGKVHAIYAKTLEELRDKEKKLCVDLYDGVRTDGATLKEDSKTILFQTISICTTPMLENHLEKFALRMLRRATLNVFIIFLQMNIYCLLQQ